MDINDEIEGSFGAGPQHRPVELTVLAGHRAVRRRRAAQVVSGLAVVAVIGAGWSVAAPGVAPRGADAPVASDPSQTAPSPTGDGPTRDPNADAYLSDDVAVGYDGQGEVVVRDDVQVVRRVDNPMDLEAPDTSVGLVVEVDGQRYWVLMNFDEKPGPGAGSAGAYDEAGATYPTYDLWLRDMVAIQTGRPMLALVAFGEGESLVPDEEGVEIVEQRPSPDLPADFAGPDDRTAVAMLTWHGDTWFALARQTDAGPPQYLPTAASVAGGATTIDEFLEYARSRYSSGEGLR